MERTALPLRLTLARSLAWAVHTSGWLVLGAVGARFVPLLLGGLLPAALWLALQAYALQARAGRPPTARSVRGGWLLAALLLVVAAATSSPWWLAAAWAAASVAASWTVRLLRVGRRSPPHQALLPAAVGVAAAGCFSLPTLLGSPAWVDLLPATSLVQALSAIVAGSCLTVGCGSARRACRRTVPDGWRALQGLVPGAWHRDDLPQRLSAAAMLPMMAGLPLMLALCTPAGGSALMVVGAHLAAMVLPGAGLNGHRAWHAHAHALTPKVPGLCAALLIAGGLALALLPLLQGLMAATLLHTAAWSIAWATGLQDVSATDGGSPLAMAPALAALAAAGGMLTIGWAVSAFGPQALWLVHLTLAALALAWVLAGAARQLGARSHRRVAGAWRRRAPLLSPWVDESS
jgi:hypothetical protein